MVARGDLGVELEVERVPFAQKLLIAKAKAAGLFVINATQVVERQLSQIPRAPLAKKVVRMARTFQTQTHHPRISVCHQSRHLGLPHRDCRLGLPF